MLNKYLYTLSLVGTEGDYVFLAQSKNIVIEFGGIFLKSDDKRRLEVNRFRFVRQTGEDFASDEIRGLLFYGLDCLLNFCLSSNIDDLHFKIKNNLCTSLSERLQQTSPLKTYMFGKNSNEIQITFDTNQEFPFWDVSLLFLSKILEVPEAEYTFSPPENFYLLTE